MKKLAGLRWQQRFNEHMGCLKGCLDYLGINLSFPWLYGGTGQAFVLNMNDTVFLDCGQEWDIAMLFDLAPNLGFTVEQLVVKHAVARCMPAEPFRQKQREAWDLIRVRIDEGTPCYAWELSPIPALSVITGYDDGGYTYSGWDAAEAGACPWDKLGTFDVRQIAVYCVHPAPPAPASQVIQDALRTVLGRVSRPDGWATSAYYRSGLAGYALWADALATGRANRDGAAYINQVWLECREMAVAFLQAARAHQPDRCAEAFDDAIYHYGVVRERLSALATLHPERVNAEDWQTTFASPEGAQLVREAAQAEEQGVVALRRIVEHFKTGIGQD